MKYKPPLNVYLVSRTDIPGYVEDQDCVVVAEDERHAERRARWSSDDFKKAPLCVTRIDITEEQMILKTNTGA